MNVTPSAVCVRKTGQIVVGLKAIGALSTDPDNVAVEFKRWMGQSNRKRFPASGLEFSAEALSAEVLKSLMDDVRRQTGDRVTSAVITVPAAFGALQCEATGRAAQLAGLEEAPLLQEPIAAAIGYGAHPGDAAQKWLVFDLGGGTLDIAVVSTRDERLTVLDHRGDNLMGGKDFDRAIVEGVLLPALEKVYDLRHRRVRAALASRLRAKAEEAKIDLSRERQVIISIYDIGDDGAGTPIELDVPLDRARLQALSEPLLERCCVLAEEALAGARISAADLDRILLVGGPTQSPSLRAFLEHRLGARVDFSADPMTVVCRGAGLYASTLERRLKGASAKDDARSEGDASAKAEVDLRLAFDPVSADLNPPVSGRVLKGPVDVEIKIDAADRAWTSGWMRPAAGLFKTQVKLVEGGVATFWVYSRDGQSSALRTDVAEFKIRHGLVPTSPPLPHTFWVELVGPDGKPTLDKIFAKNTPLPAEKTIRYRAAHAVSCSDPKSGLPIKLWEGEYDGDSEANDWVGAVLMAHDDLKSGLSAGAEIELTFKIDGSRLITVEGLAPASNQRFQKQLYVAQHGEQDFAELASTAGRDTEDYRARLENLEDAAAADGDEASLTEIESIRRDLETLAASAPDAGGDVEDPDDARRVVGAAKAVRGRINRLERKFSGPDAEPAPLQFTELVEATESVVKDFGAPIDHQQLTVMKRQLERAVGRGDTKGGQRIVEEIRAFRWRVLFNHDWFWRDIFETQCQPGTPYANSAEAARQIATGNAALASGDGAALRRAVRGLWDLQPKTNVEASRERALASGLRRH
ncbi:MAG: Hsp70 family protein [Caulobacteraceae bacterium]